MAPYYKLRYLLQLDTIKRLTCFPSDFLLKIFSWQHEGFNLIYVALTMFSMEDRYILNSTDAPNHKRQYAKIKYSNSGLI